MTSEFDPWSGLLRRISRRVERSSPISDRQIDDVERKLGFVLPRQLRELYLSIGNGAFGLLPLFTGREGQAAAPGSSPGDAMRSLLEANDSVLGWALAHAAPAIPEDDDVWPDGLLVVQDDGCAVYHAVDMKHPLLRIIRCESLEPTDDPVLAAEGAPLAYSEPDVPVRLQHRFVVAAPSLLAWLRPLAGRGSYGG